MKGFRFRSLLLVALMVLLGATLFLRGERDVPMNRDFDEFPRLHKGWRMTVEAEFSRSILNVLRPTDYLSRRYVGPDGERVELYIGYHGGGEDVGPIHSPRNCLPGGGWTRVSSETIRVPLAEGSREAVAAVYGKDETRTLFYYWFQTRGRTMTDEIELKLAELTGALLHGRKDAAFVRISVDVSESATGSAQAAERFIRDFAPVIDSFLPA